MPGPDNLRGIDYQISCSVLLILTSLADVTSELVSVRIESLDEAGEDIALSYDDGRVREVQIKKLAEGFNWTPSAIRPVLARFAALKPTADCLFLSDGNASRQILAIKPVLAGTAEPTDEIVAAISGEGLTRNQVVGLCGRVHLNTRYFPSADEIHPASRVELEIRRLLLSGPFALDDDIDNVVERLWRIVYETGRSAASLTREQLLERMALAGLRPMAADWAQYPVSAPFVPHVESVTEISRVLTEGGAQVLVGIGGCGKTTLAAEAALRAASEGHRSCWIRVSEFLDPRDLARVVAAYCVVRGLPLIAEALRNCEVAKLPTAMAGTLSQSPLPLVIDRLEAASPRLAAFIRDFMMSLPRSLGHGRIIVVSRHLPDWWPDFMRDHPQASSLVLGSLPVESGVAMLNDVEIGLDEEERRHLVTAVGAHAQSLNLLRQVRSVPDAAALTRQGVELARDWVLRRVLDELPLREKVGIARISVFDYAAPVEDVHFLLGELGPDTLRALQQRDLVRLTAGKLTVHDVIRTAALTLMSEASVRRCHGIVAEHLQRGLEQDFKRDGSVLYEKSTRWAAHLEQSDLASDLKGRMTIILAAGHQRLQDLFAIAHLGFPFAFDDPELDATGDRLEDLQNEGLIELNPANDGKEFLEGPAFLLCAFSYFETLLIDSLCFHHEYAGAVGYTNDMRANFAFGQQGLLCPWEHCIELSPLPMTSRAEWEAGLEDDRRRLLDPEAHNLTEAHIQILQSRIAEGVPDWVPADVDQDLIARGCFVFGHACPGGREQAHACRAADDFVWADSADTSTTNDQ